MSRCQEHPHEQVPVAAAAISLFASLSSVLELVLDVVQNNTKKSKLFVQKESLRVEECNGSTRNSFQLIMALS